MSKHTPGPWFVFPRGSNEMLHVGPAAHSVAFIISIDNPDANARLIAAAPLLLEACESGDPELMRAAVKAAKEG